MKPGTVARPTTDGLPLFEQLQGDTYDPEFDGPRLAGQLSRVRRFLWDGEWRTLADIRAACGGSEAACSARIRDLRKTEYGGYTVLRRRHPDHRPRAGVYQYRLLR